MIRLFLLSERQMARISPLSIRVYGTGRNRHKRIRHATFFEDKTKFRILRIYWISKITLDFYLTFLPWQK